MNWTNDDISLELTMYNEIITKRLEKLAVQAGGRVFFFYGEEDKEFTYKEFNQIANNIANNLKNIGIKKGDKVCTFLRNPLVSSLLMFGIMKIGAVFCPINFNYIKDLLSYQINDTNCTLLITEIGLVKEINYIKDDIIPLDIIVYHPQKSDHDYDRSNEMSKLDSKFKHYDYNDIIKGEYSNVEAHLNYMDIASIIYTSGTTGMPKGVVHSYRWINNYLFNRKQIHNHEDCILNDLPMHHIGGAFYNVGLAVWVGGKVACYDKFSASAYWDRVNTSEANSLVLLDVMCPWLLSAPEKSNDHINPVKHVYMQPLPNYHHQMSKRFGFDFVTSGYHQTEAGNGTYVLFDELEDGEGTPAELYKGYSKEEIIDNIKKYNIPVIKGKQEFKKGLMGKPTLLMEISVLNRDDESCKISEVGELAIRPRFPHLIMKEYYNKPEATLEAFSNLWFHTGDAAYLGEDGNYYFVDRIKGVIRVKGELVSSYQVEDVINRHEKVNISAVFPIPAELGEEDDIVAFVVPHKIGELAESEIREWLKDHLPKFMWPKHYRFVEDLPKTATSKIEKYKLKESIVNELR